MPSDGEDIQLLLPKSPTDTFKPETLFVTSSRLLVMSCESKQLGRFDGDELGLVNLSDYMSTSTTIDKTYANTVNM